MASSRRLGPRDSETSKAILDATEQIMRQEGYGAVSSRRVAEVAGIRQGLVYYYFQTMDDVLLECFKRRTAQGLARLEREVASERPVHAIWDDLTHTVDARLAFEFVALSNHHAGIRDEVNRFLTATRQLQTEAISREAERKGVELPASPTAIAFLMYCATLTIAREASTGLTEGHDEVLGLFQRLLDRLA